MAIDERLERRLRNQAIAAGARLDRPEEVVRQLGAMQAQDYRQAVWAIGSRTRGATLADVERAIEERRIVLSWPMRGTIHAVPAEELRAMLKLSESRMLAQAKRRLEQLELTEAIVERCGQLMEDAMRGGRRIARDALMRLLEEEGIATSGQRGYHILWRLSQTGHICMGPKLDKQQTFVLAREWLPEDGAAAETTRAEALGRLAARYFDGHGPATAQDLAWWAGLTLTDARLAVETARDRLAAVRLGGADYWETAAPSALPELRAGSERDADADAASVYLLAGFDEYMLGYKDRGAIMSDRLAPYVVPGNNGVFQPIIVIGGKIAGVWRRAVKPKRIDFEFRSLRPLREHEEALLAEAARYCAFMGLPPGETAFLPLEG